MKYLERKYRPKANSKECKIKQTYKDKERAGKEAKRLSEKTGKQFRYYRCYAGRHFHLTSTVYEQREC